MRNIRYNSKVLEFLKTKLTIIEIENLLDTAIYRAEQNKTVQAKELGAEFDEVCAKASLEVYKFINDNYGNIDIKCCDNSEKILEDVRYLELY